MLPTFLSISTIYYALLIVCNVDTGRVGLCRTECVEQNVKKIVRVHLKDDLVMAGLCTKKTDGTGGSIVTPFVCHRNVGLWTLDELDEEGITPFEKVCPTPEIYPSEQRATCPKVQENQDASPQNVANDEYPSSGQEPPKLFLF
uniref:Uncharacterized protein n=1 Tax=Caenorhabditis japonica TaxID=281687 RepID=A0A8R1DWV9_CAEJA